MNRTTFCFDDAFTTGLHISLGTWSDDDEERPACLREGASVSFNIANITAFPSARKTPQNLPGQRTDADGMRFYPTLWVLAYVNFVDFELATKYPPHISLACVAAQLDVGKVGRFEMEAQKEDK